MATIVLALSGAAMAQTAPKPLVNADIVQMAKAGLPASVIAAKISSSPTAFDTSISGLEHLHDSGVSAAVIADVIAAKPTAAAGGAAGPPRVYVTAEATKSSHWGVFGNRSAVAGGGNGGTDPQRDELVKTLLQRCPSVMVTIARPDADYVLDMQREPNKGYARKRNKWMLSDRLGDVLAAGSDREVGSVAKDACAALDKALGKAVASRR